jgi:large subunit ribosomal protein L1
MNKKSVLATIKEIRKNVPKKKFSQTFDLQINLKELDLKKPEHKVDIFLELPKGLGKNRTIGALVDVPLENQAKEVFDGVVTKEEFVKYKTKSTIKKLSNQYDFFVAQANLMGDIARFFGKVFGPRGKMPNPKAGAVVLPTEQNLAGLAKKLQNTVRLQTKGELGVKASMGKESLSDEDIAENVMAAYDVVMKRLPQEKNNIKSVGLKLTMSPLFIIGKKNDKA